MHTLLTPKLQQLLLGLELHRKPEPEDPYNYGRITHCHLWSLNLKALFEVRGWDVYTSDIIGAPVLNISVVNWTHMAGTGSIHLVSDSQAETFVIYEDTPSVQVLYGK